MGLLDDLAGKAFDEAAATRRGRRARHESARDLLVIELRAYSENIERMRIALINLVESLKENVVLLEASSEPALAALKTVVEACYPVPEIDEACDQLMVDVPFDRTEWTAVNTFLQDQLQLQLLGSSYAKSITLSNRSREEREELDLAWSRVRPLLDDLVEVQAVMALRSHRHDLRNRLDYAWRAISDLHRLRAGSPAVDAQRRRQIVDVLTDIIRFADAWNTMIGDVRGRSGRLPRR